MEMVRYSKKNLDRRGRGGEGRARQVLKLQNNSMKGSLLVSIICFLLSLSHRQFATWKL